MNLQVCQTRELGAAKIAFIFLNTGMRYHVLRQLSSACKLFGADMASAKLNIKMRLIVPKQEIRTY